MPDFIVFSALFAKLLGARIILDVHDTMPEAYATKFDLDLRHPLIAAIRVEERLSAALANFVITTNELHREALVGHGIPARKIVIVMNVGNPSVFKPRSRRRTPPPGQLVLGYHGTVAERLGLDLVVEAVDRARSFCPGVRFLLIGDGEFMPQLRRLVAQRQLQGIIELRGWVPVEALPEALAAIDIGVVGNRKITEMRKNWMLPVKMLEYTAMEIPTIAPRLRAITRYFSDDNAFLYVPDDADDLARVICEICASPARIDRLRAGLQTFNERFNWPSMARTYVNLVANSTGMERA
jgi:glycosyltransferase involved in cell wall biosynthesis